jgi:hypothetical protein
MVGLPSHPGAGDRHQPPMQRLRQHHRKCPPLLPQLRGKALNTLLQPPDPDSPRLGGTAGPAARLVVLGQRLFACLRLAPVVLAIVLRCSLLLLCFWALPCLPRRPRCSRCEVAPCCRSAMATATAPCGSPAWASKGAPTKEQQGAAHRDDRQHHGSQS